MPFAQFFFALGYTSAILSFSQVAIAMSDTERQTKISRPTMRADGAHPIPLDALTSHQQFDRTDLIEQHHDLVQQLLDAARHPIAVCDAGGDIVLCNAAWSVFDDGYFTFAKSFPEGANLLDTLRTSSNSPAPYANELIAAVRTALEQESESSVINFSSASSKPARVFKATARALHNTIKAAVVVTFEEVSAGMVPAVEPPEEIAAAINSLSQRERQILDLVLAGEPNKLIATQLDLSQKTVEKHRSSLMRKLGAQNVVHLVRKVLGQDGPLRADQPESR